MNVLKLKSTAQHAWTQRAMHSEGWKTGMAPPSSLMCKLPYLNGLPSNDFSSMIYSIGRAY
eukprot:1827450-Karenia_brevis.AAC.1